MLDGTVEFVIVEKAGRVEVADCGLLFFLKVVTLDDDDCLAFLTAAVDFVVLTGG